MSAASKFIGNTVRQMASLFPGYFAEAKHNHYLDFGYPLNVTFEQCYAMFMRNGFARAGVNKTILKTWQNAPEIWENDTPEETTLETELRIRFEDLRVWQSLAETDRRSLVGGYSAAILRVADSKLFQEPVERVPGGLEGLVEVIPAWSGQLTVAEYDTDERSAEYGKPKMYQFNEAAVGAGGTNSRVMNNRNFMVHPDRVILWSYDGTVNARSYLEPGYNDLLTLEKVSGAGGEGFWKNARSSLVLEVDKEAKIEEMAKYMGVKPADVVEAMNTQVEDFQKGFDKVLMTQGMKAETLGITLPSPEHFFNIALQGFAASIDIPLKILVGNQTGERASTEDAREWSQTNMSRRNDYVVPTIRMLVNRLERFGIIPEREWTVEWNDLTESTMEEKINRADKMATINQKLAKTNELAFLPSEIRAAVDMDPLTDAERFLTEPVEDDPMDPNADNQDDPNADQEEQP